MGHSLLTGETATKMRQGEDVSTEIRDYKLTGCPGAGACQFMGTASTMQCMSEALGMALPGAALSPASMFDIRRQAREAGRQIMTLARKGIRPAQILTRAAFENAIKVHAAILNGKIEPGSVVVLRYEGLGGSGMLEILACTEALVTIPQLSTTAIVTDGRFSGANRGPCVGHVSPEAARGGPIALVEDGDLISIDIPNRGLLWWVAVENAKRRAKFGPCWKSGRSGGSPPR
jgi:dihydroxyacid dehydratase/phosphogluconate dehydratase